MPPTLLVLLAMTFVAFTTLPIDWNHAGTGLEGVARWSAVSTVMTAIGIGWGVTWFAYAADYSRFVPRSASPARLYFTSTLGQFIPVVWLGVLGAGLATISKTADPGQLIVDAYGALAIPVLLLVLHGPVATNILNTNRRVQRGSVIQHGATDCLENAGRQPASVYARATMYTPLSPCSMCSGAILLYKIPRLVIGESTTFTGAEDWLAGRGVRTGPDGRCRMQGPYEVIHRQAP